jgi:hypothetical protein
MAIVLDVSKPIALTAIALLIRTRGQWVGWTGMVRVDGKTYTWMGAPKDYAKATQTAAEFTSTSSIFTIRADNKVSIKVSFLSPVTPNDLKRQSLIFSYMQVEVSSIDGSDHKVQIYTDISAGMDQGSSRNHTLC